MCEFNVSFLKTGFTKVLKVVSFTEPEIIIEKYFLFYFSSLS